MTDQKHDVAGAMKVVETHALKLRTIRRELHEMDIERAGVEDGALLESVDGLMEDAVGALDIALDKLCQAIGELRITE